MTLDVILRHVIPVFKLQLLQNLHQPADLLIHLKNYNKKPYRLQLFNRTPNLLHDILHGRTDLFLLHVFEEICVQFFL